MKRNEPLIILNFGEKKNFELKIPNWLIELLGYFYWNELFQPVTCKSDDHIVSIIHILFHF